MRIFRELRELVTHPKKFFAEPVTPYVKADQQFREELQEVTSIPLIQKLRAHLDKRYSLRIGSVANAILVLTVALAATFTYLETVSDRLVSVEPWARPLFLVPLWTLLIAVRFFLKAIMAPESEINPNPAYTGDEIKNALKVTTGDTTLQPFVGEEGKRVDPDAHLAALELAQLTEVASRTNHDRVGLHAGRYYRNKALRWLGYSVTSLVVALSIYAVASPLLS